MSIAHDHNFYNLKPTNFSSSISKSDSKSISDEEFENPMIDKFKATRKKFEILINRNSTVNVPSPFVPDFSAQKKKRNSTLRKIDVRYESRKEFSTSNDFQVLKNNKTAFLAEKIKIVNSAHSYDSGMQLNPMLEKSLPSNSVSNFDTGIINNDCKLDNGTEILNNEISQKLMISPSEKRLSKIAFASEIVKNARNARNFQNRTKNN
jgi:hypothetical protein